MASILKLDTLQTPSGTGIITSPNTIVSPGATVGVQHWVDYTNINTSSTTFIDLYTMTYTKKIANSALFGFFDINTLREGSQEQHWAVEINGTMVSELRHKSSSTSGWDTKNSAFNWSALSGSTAGVYTIKLRMKVVTFGYYNYQTAFGNGSSHFTIMEIAQ
jgi:hypothetical protein